MSSHKKATLLLNICEIIKIFERVLKIFKIC